jgi:hypothetical protein
MHEGSEANRLLKHSVFFVDKYTFKGIRRMFNRIE